MGEKERRRSWAHFQHHSLHRTEGDVLHCPQKARQLNKPGQWCLQGLSPEELTHAVKVCAEVAGLS